MRPISCVPAFLAALLGCQATPAPDTTAEAKQAIDAPHPQWPRLTPGGHADSPARVYPPAPGIPPPTMRPLHGPAPPRALCAVLPVMPTHPPGPPAPVAPTAGVRALWVVRSTLADPDSARAMVRRAAEAGFNTLIVQVRGRGDAYYRSRWEPPPPALAGRNGYDALGRTIRE